MNKSSGEDIDPDFFITRKVFSQRKFNEKYLKNEKPIFDIKRKFKNISLRNVNIKKQLYARLPILRWLLKYKIRENFILDLVSGITVGIVQITQGMAYGLLANLPSVNGIYTSLYPGLIYCLFGTSQHISIGAYAVVSMMVGNTVTKVV